MKKMIDFGDCTWYCHWDKGLICKRQFQCDGCKHQPADEDKENGKADPVHIRWSEDYDGSKVPECPSCGQMAWRGAFSADRSSYQMPLQRNWALRQRRCIWTASTVVEKGRWSEPEIEEMVIFMGDAPPAAVS